jgi:hypothetical protein
MAKTGNTVHFNPEGMGGIVRKVGLTLVVLVMACVVGSASCTRVDVGHVGIRVKLAGSDARGAATRPS